MLERELINYLLVEVGHDDRRKYLVGFVQEMERRHDLIPLERYMMRRYLYDAYCEIEGIEEDIGIWDGYLKQKEQPEFDFGNII